jgi:hypothetical protein
MAEVINLRQARKAKTRDAAAQAAQENRAKFGQTKAHKAKVAKEQARASKAHGGHKRCDGGEDPC